MLSVLAIFATAVVQGIALLVSYITNNTFPLPLSEKDEQLYLEKLKAGDEKAKGVLIEHNLRLVAHIVKKFDNTGEDVDDLISIGTIGLIKAINTFDPAKKIRLATYAARCIENEILMHLRSTRRVRSEVSLYDPIGVDKEGNEITLIDVLGTAPDVVGEAVENQCEQERLSKQINRLSTREKWVLQMRFGMPDGSRKTQRDIAKLLGISRSYVSRIEKRAIGKLGKNLSAEDNQ
ncbi:MULTISPECIES: RNA polymerase sporulation sigma factor SigK [Propionispora]|uniref:RNA polymerase sigma factor n=2 Tax=Propionispora TaxID=112902 RepID=A0A1H8SDZ2_9FIRM|nr:MULTISPECIES: RNA polymerase sporulation sigma factor SigK [Propionispora]SEO76950.1 RNA polymerase, sigma 27/28 subunit, RpsK/SigK [Propionispora vibrioides]SHK06975.1 RNA polymerase, sigma 27/28 subunit, RpsK/SigK [Propionispora hippei DSM 15287]